MPIYIACKRNIVKLIMRSRVPMRFVQNPGSV
jgi:hypothetical protein